MKARGGCACTQEGCLEDDHDMAGIVGGSYDPRFGEKVARLSGRRVPEERVARLSRAGLSPEAAARVVTMTKAR